MKIIAFEGIDGSGLTTHTRLAVDYLSSRGVKACLWKEPTRGPVGRLIREFLAGREPDSDVLALLFAADRLWGLRFGVREACGGAEVLVFDRYKYSSLAYQGVASGLDWVESLNSKAPEADAIIYIDVPVGVALSRISSRGSTEALEDPGFLARVRESFREVLERARSRGVKVYIVEGVRGGVERSIEDVAGEVRSVLDEILGRWQAEARA
ncbi:MAG: dTMP kinase [Aeropyrum sp.]|nr:dTMP kinase [Aeropyrum sp.]